MFNAALLTLGKRWRQPRDLSTDEGINKILCVYMDYYCVKRMKHWYVLQYGRTLKMYDDWEKTGKRPHITWFCIIRNFQNSLCFVLFWNSCVCLFIYFWLHRLFVAMCGLFQLQWAGSTLWLWYRGFSSRWLLLLRSTGSRVRAWQLWLTGLVALWHVGSSSTRGQTCIPCIGRWIFIHWTTREVLSQSM